MKFPFGAALMRSTRGYHMHQRTGRVGASGRKSLDVGAASSFNPYLASVVLIHTAAFVHVLVLLAAGFALCFGDSINLT